METIRACVPRPRPPIPPHAAEMAAMRADLWVPGSTITVAFDYTSLYSERKAIRTAWEIWQSLANIHFVQVVDPRADVRITFIQDGRSWSYIGRESLSPTLAGQATANMGWLNDPARDLHETGHMLGLVHEHQWGNIPWNREACYRYYGAYPNNWTEQEVDEQVLDRLPQDELLTSSWDRLSIMCYPIPAGLVTDPKFSAGWNQALSPTDRSKIVQLYPKKGKAS